MEMSKYKYLAIDVDGGMHECTSEPFDNGFGRWFTKDFFGADDTMRKIDRANIDDYIKVLDARNK